MPAHCITIALGLSQMRVIGERETEQEIRIELEYLSRTAICPRCRQKTPKVHSIGAQHRRDRTLWDKPVFLVVRKRRFRCLSSGQVFTEPDPVCDHRRRTSQRFCRELGEEAIHQPVRHVAQKEG